MDNNCVDCQARATIGLHRRCTVCYLLNRMDRLGKQLSRTKSLYWRALAASTLPPTITSSDNLKNNVKKVDSSEDIQTAYLTLAERVKSGKIDSFNEVSTVVYPDVIICEYSATRGSYTMYRKVSLPVKTVGEATGIVLRKLISYIDSYDYSYKPDLDYDYDHEDELGRPLYPPKRTEKETEILQKELDRELNEYMGVSSISLNKVSSNPKSIGLRGIIPERRDSVKEGTEVDWSKRAEKEKVLLKELGRDMGFKERTDYANPKYFKSLRYGKMVTLPYPEKPKTIELVRSGSVCEPEWYLLVYKSMVNSLLNEEIPQGLFKKLTRILDEAKTHLEKPNPTTMELRGIIIEKRDNPEWYRLVYRSIMSSVLNKEILYKYFEVLTTILEEAKTELKVKERRERFGLSSDSELNTVTLEELRIQSRRNSLVGLGWD